LSAAAAIFASERSVAVHAETVEAVTEPLTLHYQRHDASEETEAQVIRIGPAFAGQRGGDQSLWIVALPGEPFTTYETDLASRFFRRCGVARDQILTCGYSNDAVGYLCTPRALREGGYESDKSHTVYHRPAAFSASTQDRVLKGTLRAATRLMARSVPRDAAALPFWLRRLGQLPFFRLSRRSHGL